MKLLKQILFILFFLTFCGELIQNNHVWIKSPPLQGGIITVPKPKFNFDNWLSGNYQDSLMTYFEQNLDLHVPLIRLHNQIAFSAFRETNLTKCESGKNQVLFDIDYIKSYLGRNFIGEDAVINKAKKLAYIQAELKKRNIDLLYVIAPGKPYYSPDLLPSKYDLAKKTRTNYDAFAEQFEKQKINYIDFVKYFQKLKSKTKYPLFTRCGVHWSGYGITVAADTLFRTMEKLRNIDLIDFYANGGEETFEPRSTDADIGDAMSLVYKIPSFKMYYPNIVFKGETNKVKPNVLIVGDSYVWGFLRFYKYMPKLFNDKSVFWYYNREVFGTAQIDIKPYSVSELNLEEQLRNRDYVLIVFTETNLDNCGFGFIDQAYDLLKKEHLN